jgi:hypothetical protein
MQKRTEITIETEHVLVVSQRHERAGLWCRHCATTLPMLTVDAAAGIAGVTPLVIFRLAEAGNLHVAITPEGRLVICPNSLPLETPEGFNGNPTSTQHFDFK